MRVLVCGGREYSDDRFLDWVLTKLPISVIIHGAARGADSLAKEWADAYHILEVPFPANWDKYGKSAGHRRNTQMLVEGHPDYVVAFRGGRGTNNMIRQAKSHGLEVLPL